MRRYFSSVSVAASKLNFFIRRNLNRKFASVGEK
jgi:hypothetical protein